MRPRTRTVAGSLRVASLIWAVVFICTSLAVPAMCGDNQVMGEVQFEGKSNVAKTSGVWVDGQYVGYVKELKGSKKVMLLPGEHVIVVRQDGYDEFTDRVTIEPGQTQVVQVEMHKAVTPPPSRITAEVKIDVNPSRAAVFLDGLYVGHVGEFGGVGKGMLVSPGRHKISIALAGYQTFDTDINPIADQKVQIKTDLVKNGAPVSAPLSNTDTGETAAPPASGTAAAPAQP